MSHLSTEQLIDLAEGAQPATSAAHLHACAECRRQLDDLRATMASVAHLEVPEPSPLFWDHLSARVRAAVEHETPDAQMWFGRRWLWLGGVAALASAVVAVQMYRSPADSIGSGTHTTRPASQSSAGAAAPSAPPVSADDLALGDAASFSLVADLTADFDWDAAVEAGLTTHVGADDDLVLLLSEAEREELGKLLHGELPRPQRGA